MEARKDNRGRRLKKGEFVRKSDGRFCFSYSDALGRRRYIYDRDLLSLEKRKKKSNVIYLMVWICTRERQQPLTQHSTDT
jgi:hypothetical protein